MKHLFTALFILMASATTMYGQTVSLSDAQQKASAFLSQHTAGAKGGTTAEVKLAYTAQQGDETYYYVFNQSGGGFVIVGGDEAARTILGYVDHGTFDYATAPENVKWWLGQYQQQISSAIKGVKQGTISLSQPAKGKVNTIARADIAPLVETTWDQVAPFNTAIPKFYTQCSYTDYNNATATGCVATAAAQVMFYHKYPTTGRGSKTYESAYSKTYSADFGSTTYQWDKMTTTYSYNSYSGTDSGTGTDAENAVATLMYHCGVAASMNYCTFYNGGSSASTEVLGRGMINYFGYDKGMSFEERVFYNDDTWAEMIYAELASDRPVIYSGSTGSAGHSFICDGYKYEDGNDLYHMNWGWSGNCNGFFPLQGTANGVKALTPDGTGSGGGAAGSSYDQDQDVLIGIQPNQGNAYACKVTNPDGYSLSNGASTITSLNVGAKLYLLGIFKNSSFETKSLSYGVRLENTSTNESIYLKGPSNNLDQNSFPLISSNVKGFSLNIFAEAGQTYHVYPTYYDNAEETPVWKDIPTTQETIPTLEITEGNTLYLTDVPSFGKNGEYTILDGTNDESMNLTLKFKNNSGADINNKLIVTWIYPESGGSSCGYWMYYLTLANGESTTVELNKTNTSGLTLTENSRYSIEIDDYTSGTTLYNLYQTYFIPTAKQTIDYKLSSAGWGTLCLPFSAEKPAGLTLYEVTDVEGSLLTKSEATEIAMNKAYLVSGTAGTYSFTGPTTPTGQYQNGLLVGNTTNEAVYVPQGSYVMQNLPATGLAFYKVAADNTQRCSPYKAYLKVPDALSYLFSSLLFTDSTTGITSTTDAETQKQSIRKTVKDGHIVIVTPNGTFTTAGTMIK